MRLPLPLLLAPLLCLLAANAHSMQPDDTWADTHMRSEHHIYAFDAASFFSLHDFDGNNLWTRDEVLRFYGCSQDDDSEPVSEATKMHVWKTISELLGVGWEGAIEREGWLQWANAGGILPDFGLGPGHHGDAEYEYEIHHYEKYHGDETTEAELNHPEDIEHFRRHDLEEDAENAQAVLERDAIIEGNIPMKFRPRE